VVGSSWSIRHPSYLCQDLYTLKLIHLKVSLNKSFSAPPLIRFRPDPRRESVPLLLKRQCGRTLGAAARPAAVGNGLGRAHGARGGVPTPMPSLARPPLDFSNVGVKSVRGGGVLWRCPPSVRNSPEHAALFVPAAGRIPILIPYVYYFKVTFFVRKPAQ
jgi:hypothetical protein